MLKNIICGIGAIVICSLTGVAGYNYGYYMAKDEAINTTTNEAIDNYEVPVEKRTIKLSVIIELKDYAKVIAQAYDDDNLLRECYTTPDYIFDYDKNTGMYIGWTSDYPGHRDYAVWYDSKLPDMEWYSSRL